MIRESLKMRRIRIAVLECVVLSVNSAMPKSKITSDDFKMYV